MAKVDIVIPCYNYGRFLEASVGSVLGQSIRDLRVLIIDDASSDDSLDVARKLARADRRVSVVAHGHNQGHIATYNEGLLEWASAEYSLLLSADDALAPGALARATEILDRHDDIGMIYGAARVMIGDNYPAESAEHASGEYRLMPGSRFLQFCCENCFNPVPTPTAVVRTEVQHRVGGYRAENPHTGDLEMWMRIAVHFCVGVLRAVQGYYRWHGGNMGNLYYDQVLSDRREFADTFEYVLSPLTVRFPESRQWLSTMRRRLEEQALWSASNAFDRAEMEEHYAWLQFAKEISLSGHCSPVWLRLQVRRLLGQSIWQKVRPTINRLRGKSIALAQRRKFRPNQGDEIGWWPR